jgi:hypothetical protein
MGLRDLFRRSRIDPEHVIEALTVEAVALEELAARFGSTLFLSLKERCQAAIENMHMSWSGSWIGYQSRVYTDGLRARAPGEYFDSEWGANGGFNDRTRGRWAEYSPEAIQAAILRQVGKEGLEALDDLVEEAERTFRESRDRLLPLLDAILSRESDAPLKTVRGEIAKLESHMRAEDFEHLWRPKSLATRDARAASEGPCVPEHLRFQAHVLESYSYGCRSSATAQTPRNLAALSV